MLTRLHIRNYTLIDHLELDFGPGFSALTGETGAGKSILIDALGLLLGDRARSDLIRAGATRAELSAEFDLRDLPAAGEWLVAEGLDDGEACVLRRVLQRDGGSRMTINGRPVTAQSLRDMGLGSIVSYRPQADKVARAMRQSAVFEAGRVHLPEDAPWLADYLKELLGFPGTKHDDQVDSTTQYLGWTKTNRPIYIL